MYRCQLNFVMFCAKSALGISWQHFSHPNLLVCTVYKFHVYFHVRLILHDLGISLPHEDGFSKKILTLKVLITVFVMTMTLMYMKHGFMGIGFIRQPMAFWSRGKGHRKVSTRQCYTMDNHTLQE